MTLLEECAAVVPGAWRDTGTAEWPQVALVEHTARGADNVPVAGERRVQLTVRRWPGGVTAVWHAARWCYVGPLWRNDWSPLHPSKTAMGPTAAAALQGVWDALEVGWPWPWRPPAGRCELCGEACDEAALGLCWECCLIAEEMTTDEELTTS